MNRLLLIGLGCGVALLFTGETAEAGLAFALEFNQSNYLVSPGGTVDVQVDLRQTGTPGVGEVNILGAPGRSG